MKNHPNFYVIEGLDGSGKSTQLRLLREFFQKKGIKFRDIHFPRMNQGYYGALTAEFLRGEFGAINEVHPKLVALIYAGDRKEHIHQIQNWLDEGCVVVADRYVNSNIVFQCAKLKTAAEKAELRDWIMEFEYDYHQLPKATLSLFLDVPFDAVEKSLTNVREGEDRAYLKGKKDIHESSLSFQEKVRREYLDLVKIQKDFVRVKCYDEEGQFLSPEQIHKKILQQLKLG